MGDRQKWRARVGRLSLPPGNLGVKGASPARPLDRLDSQIFPLSPIMIRVSGFGSLVRHRFGPSQCLVVVEEGPDLARQPVGAKVRDEGERHRHRRAACGAADDPAALRYRQVTVLLDPVHLQSDFLPRSAPVLEEPREGFAADERAGLGPLRVRLEDDPGIDPREERVQVAGVVAVRQLSEPLR
jgi:hypothetical protein